MTPYHVTRVAVHLDRAVVDDEHAGVGRAVHRHAGRVLAVALLDEHHLAGRVGRGSCWRSRCPWPWPSLVATRAPRPDMRCAARRRIGLTAPTTWPGSNPSQSLPLCDGGSCAVGPRWGNGRCRRRSRSSCCPSCRSGPHRRRTRRSRGAAVAPLGDSDTSDDHALAAVDVALGTHPHLAVGHSLRPALVPLRRRRIKQRVGVEPAVGAGVVDRLERSKSDRA